MGFGYDFQHLIGLGQSNSSWTFRPVFILTSQQGGGIGVFAPGVGDVVAVKKLLRIFPTSEKLAEGSHCRSEKKAEIISNPIILIGFFTKQAMTLKTTSATREHILIVYIWVLEHQTICLLKQYIMY